MRARLALSLGDNHFTCEAPRNADGGNPVRREVPVTVRVPAELKERVDLLASEVGISSSAVWKILLHRSIRPILDGESFRAVDLFRMQEADAVGRTSQPEVQGPRPPGYGPTRLDLVRRPRGTRP